MTKTEFQVPKSDHIKWHNPQEIPLDSEHSTFHLQLLDQKIKEEAAPMPIVPISICEESQTSPA